MSARPSAVSGVVGEVRDRVIRTGASPQKKSAQERPLFGPAPSLRRRSPKREDAIARLRGFVLFQGFHQRRVADDAPRELANAHVQRSTTSIKLDKTISMATVLAWFTGNTIQTMA